MKLSVKTFLLIVLFLWVQFSGSNRPLNAASDLPDPILQDIAGPIVQMDERAYDFGLVGGHDRIEHTFHVKNPGSAALEIRNVQVSWGCKVRFDRSIPPGGEGQITLIIDLDSCKGSTKKSAIVTTNDPNNGSFWLNVTWHL